MATLQIRSAKEKGVPGFEIPGRDSTGSNIRIFVQRRETAEAIRAVYYAAGWRDGKAPDEASWAKITQLVIKERR